MAKIPRDPLKQIPQETRRSICLKSIQCFVPSEELINRETKSFGTEPLSQVEQKAFVDMSGVLSSLDPRALLVTLQLNQALFSARKLSD